MDELEALWQQIVSLQEQILIMQTNANEPNSGSGHKVNQRLDLNKMPKENTK